jgi:hypothetical protein
MKKVLIGLFWASLLMGQGGNGAPPFVSSFNTRTGAVTLTSGDVNAAITPCTFTSGALSGCTSLALSGSSSSISFASNTGSLSSGQLADNAGCLNFNDGVATRNLPQTLTTTGASGAATLSGCVLNIPQYSASSGIGGGASGWSGLPLTFVSTATQYAPPVGGALTSATESVVQLASPVTGSFSGLTVTLSGSLGAATTLAVTLRLAGSSTALTCTTASAGTTCSDTTHTVSVAQGQLLDFLLVSSGTVTAGLPQVEIGYAVLATSSGFGYTLISKQVLGSAAASVTISSIPGTFNNLRLTISGACSASASNANILMQFNSDTGADYAAQTVYGVQALTPAAGGFATGTIGGGQSTSLFVGPLDCASAPSNASGVITIEIPNYSGTTFSKKVLANSIDTFNSTNMAIEVTGGWWTSTSAITAMSFTVSGGSNFVTGSTFVLYGY